jgi:hypothetical protein
MTSHAAVPIPFNPATTPSLIASPISVATFNSTVTAVRNINSIASNAPPTMFFKPFHARDQSPVSKPTNTSMMPPMILSVF